MPKETKRSATPSLQWCVVATLAWFNTLGRPLPVADIRRLLLRREASEEALKTILAKLGRKVVKKDGLYSLAETEVTYPSPERERWYRYKWWRVRLAVGLIRWIPYVRMVAVANTLADQTADRDSDIDVFIIVKHERLYLTRTLITVMLQLAGLRRHSGNAPRKFVANRICLSFYATTNHRDFRSIALSPYDIYLAYWIFELVPVLNVRDTFADFLKTNHWVTDFVPGQREIPKTRGLSWPARTTEWVLDHTFGVDFERSAAKWWHKRIDRRTPSPDPDVQIIATDDMLKFHEKDRRRMYREQWEKLMEQHGYRPDQLLK